MNSSPSQLKMHYGDCPKKIESRFQTIINTYRKHYNRVSIPEDTQYWSICGRCSYSENKMEDNCEPDQLIKSGLIKPHQFNGVEIDGEIYNWNKQSNKEIKWHLGDFYETMVEYSNKNIFKPCIINADMLLMPKWGSQYLAKIMQFLSFLDNEIMLVSNLVTEHRHFRSGIKEIMIGLQEEPLFQFANNKSKWETNSEYYWYKGTGKNHTKMTTVNFFKK